MRILGSQNAFQDERERGEGTQPGDGFPGDFGIARFGIILAEVGLSDMRWKREIRSLLTLFIAPARRVYRDDQRLVARRFSTPNEAFGVLGIIIELEPERATGGFGYILHAMG